MKDFYDLHSDREDEALEYLEDEYEIVGRVFEAQYHGRCALNYEHKIKRGDKVARVQKADNPMIPVPGVACKNCSLTLPRAKL